MLYKKELDAVPPLPMPDVKQGKSYSGRHQYAVNAVLTDLPRSGRVLIVDVLHWDDHSLKLRFASNGESYAVKEHPGGTWSQKNPEYQLQMSNVTENDAVVPMVRKFLNSYGSSVMGCVGRYISAIGFKKRLAAADSKGQLMKRHFAMYPELPENLSSWCDANVFDKYYLFFGKVEKQGKRKAWCSGCGLTFHVDKNAVHHNEQWICPKCGRTVTCKSNWYRSEIVETATVCIASKVDGQLLLRWVTADRRYIYPEFRQRYAFHSHAYNLYLKGEKIYFYKLVSAPYTYGWTWYRGKLGEECYDSAFVYPDNLREVFGEKYYNVDLQEGFTGKHAPVNFCELLNQLKNEPAAEYLFKMGLPRLASELGKFRYVPDDTNFKDLFGVGKEYVPMFRQMDVSLFEVKLIREAGCWVTPQMLQQWRDLRIPACRMDGIRSLLKKVSFTRFLNYLTKQKALQKRTAEHCLQLWLDYIHMSRELQVELNSKTLLCPKDIKVAHDQLVEGYEAIQAARRAEQDRKRAASEAKAAADKARKYKAAVKELCERLTLEGYERNGLLVILPCCQEDLVREGQILGHCVGRMGYDGSTIRGESCIIFIRETTEPDKPFYTMEYDLKTGRIRQLYGKGNKAATPAVRRFAEGYVKQIKPKQILEVKTA